MPISGEPFRPMKLEEEREDTNRRTLNVSLNADDEDMLAELQTIFDVKSEGKALKLGAEIGLNVLHHTFGDKKLRYLFKKERARKDE